MDAQATLSPQAKRALPARDDDAPSRQGHGISDHTKKFDQSGRVTCFSGTGVVGQLVLLRHGESLWNRENRFTGWVDIDLSDAGVAEAARAGELLRAAGYAFDRAFTSLLKRAIRTLWLTLDELDQMWIPVENHWRLNERHYGALQGLNKAETAQRHGKEKVHQWRRSYAIRPPAMKMGDHDNPAYDRRYKEIPDAERPLTESLADTVKRCVPYYEERVKPLLLSGETILITAHGNSLRALVKYLDRISDDAIPSLNIPTGVPLIYEMDAEATPLRHYYLGDAPEKQPRTNPSDT